MSGAVQAKAVYLANGGVLLTFRYNALAIAALKDGIPPHCRSWDSDSKCWLVNRMYAADAIAILRRFFSPVDVIDERRKEPPPPPPPPPPPRYSSFTGPHATLHLLPTAPRELIEAAWKCLAKLEHPDMKRDSEKATATRRMQEINAAYDQLRKGAR